MDFLEILANDCNFNLSSPLFADLSSVPEEQLRVLMADIHVECKQDSVEVLMKDVWESYPGYMKANHYLRVYVPPVLLFFGTFGNVASFIILAKSMFRVGTYSYLTILAVMDTLVIYNGLFRMLLENFTIDLQHRMNILCKLVNLFGYVCSDTSVWLIVAVTVERFLAVNLPLRAPRMCNARRARWIILVLFLSLFALNMHFLWTIELNPENQLCDAGPSYKVLVRQVWPWVDAAIYSMVPFLIISILNVSIIRGVLFARRKRTILQMHPLVLTTRRQVPRKITKQPNEHSRSLTCMLLVISFSFVLTTLPMNVFTIVNAFVGPGTQSESEDDAMLKFATFKLARTVVELLMYLNHSINFFLYCAMGEKFRLQFRMMISRCLRGKPDYLFRGMQRSQSMTSSSKLSRVQSTKRSVFIDMRD